MMISTIRQGSLGLPTYWSEANGQIVQVGSLTVSSSGTMTATFPIPFPTQCQGVLLSATSSNDGIECVHSLVTSSTAGFTMQITRISGTDDDGTPPNVYYYEARGI